MKKLFEPQVSRLPNHYPEVKSMIEAIWHSFWIPDDFAFNSDRLQYGTVLTPAERNVVKRSLLAISQIEVSVKTFWANLGLHLPQPIFSDLGYTFASNEVIHGYAYERLLVILGLENEFLVALEQENVLKERLKTLQRHSQGKNIFPHWDRRQEFIYSLILFTMFVENVSLFSQFYILTHFNRWKIYLKDVAQQVKYTQKEEQLHSETGFWIINKLYEQYPELFTSELISEIRKNLLDMLSVEYKLVSWILENYYNENLSPEIVNCYVDRRFMSGLEKMDLELFRDAPVGPHSDELLYKISWAEEEENALTLTDFFMARPVEYTKGVKGLDKIF